jgi:predicted ATPase
LTAQNAPAIALICRRLDGLPLAIELAAARLNVLSAEQIATRLEDRFRLLVGTRRVAPVRQQTLKATIDWSYDLLSEAERQLFQALAVFAGGCDLEAVEAVCGGSGVGPADLLDVLGHLVDKSLVVAEPDSDGATRYVLHESLRQYALERLARSGEVEDTRRRHACYYAGFVQPAEAELRGPRHAGSTSSGASTRTCARRWAGRSNAAWVTLAPSSAKHCGASGFPGDFWPKGRAG